MDNKKEKAPSIYKPESNWCGRSLKNYKLMHRDSAAERDNVKAFDRCDTLTAARKLAFGLKKGQTAIKKQG